MDLRRRRVAHGPGEVEIHVEELVLIGFPPIDCHAVAEALQQELTDAVGSLSGGKAWAEGTAWPVVAGSIELGPERPPGELGASVARTVARSLLR
jgi:hypothetical protein